jgi:predicted amidophosphoribosyltransferase
MFDPRLCSLRNAIQSLNVHFLETIMQQCPNCWEPMSITANLCPHCGHGGRIAAQPSKRRSGYVLWLSFILMLAFAVLLVRYLGILP